MARRWLPCKIYTSLEQGPSLEIACWSWSLTRLKKHVFGIEEGHYFSWQYLATTFHQLLNLTKITQGWNYALWKRWLHFEFPYALYHGKMWSVYSEEERIVQMAHLTSIIIEINLFYSATSEEAVAFHIFPKAQETSNTLEYSLAQHFIPYCMSCARLCCDSIVQFKIQLQNSLKNGSLWFVVV